MCIAVPGRVLSEENGKARVDFNGNVMEVDMRLVDAGTGDYVLVHAGCAIEVINKEFAQDLSALFAEIEGI
jgi:hydrogenase expression/formation protein HypC